MVSSLSDDNIICNFPKVYPHDVFWICALGAVVYELFSVLLLLLL